MPRFDPRDPNVSRVVCFWCVSCIICALQISKGSVICLQEVGIQWAGDLHVYFMARGYAFVTAHYGHHFNNYMGEALAEQQSMHCSCGL